MLYRKIAVIFMTLFLFSHAASARDIVEPSPDIAPAEVIAIQLNGLQYNDMPETDAGIRQAWAFAHPRNRAATGPLPRFTMMLKGPGYEMMLLSLIHI